MSVPKDKPRGPTCALTSPSTLDGTLHPSKAPERGPKGLDAIPGVKVAFNWEGHGKITTNAAAGVISGLPPNFQNLISLLNLPINTQSRDIWDVFSLGHWTLDGQKHHFMRFEDDVARFQTNQEAYNDAVNWILDEGAESAKELYTWFRHPRLEILADRAGEHLGNALHSLQDSFAPGHVDRNKDSLRITRLHVYDGENQHPTTPDRKPHEEYDKEWGVKDQRGNFAGFTELGQAAVDASKALINCVIKAASVSHPDKEFRWMAEALVVNRYLLVDQRLLDANTLEDRKKWQEKVKKSEEERKQKQFDKYEMHR